MNHHKHRLFVAAVFTGLAAAYLHACNVTTGGLNPGGNTPTDAGATVNPAPTDSGTPPSDTGATPIDTGSPIENPCAGGACPRVIQLTAGDRYTCALLEDRTVRCWGVNSSGRLGDGTTMTRLRPTPVTGLAGVAQVAVGYEHTCAVKTDGTVWCWGAGTNGQLGNGANNESDVPVQVRGVTGARRVTLGRYHSCAVAGDARVRCWGRGVDLGTGSIQSSNVPLEAVGVTGATDVAASSAPSGPVFTCALVTGGAVKCWGDNDTGQLGNNTRDSSRTAVDVMGITGATALAVGGSHACVAVSNGMRCWGEGYSGQLGDGAREHRLTPVAVVGLTGVRSIALGHRHSCAILGDGTASCWGQGGQAQLGRGVIPPIGMLESPMPGAVVVLREVVSLAGGSNHSCASTMDGVTRCWGGNGGGELGNGVETTLERQPTPSPVRW
jgi:alpha-tubulin suppressor-like RCC1 family protein